MRAKAEKSPTLRGVAGVNILQVNCYNTVIEALACGTPVIGSAVGEGAGAD
jgi:hypothetical protein